MQRSRTVTAAELTQALAEPRPPVIVDIRGPDAYAAGHIPGAIHVPVHDLGHRRSELPTSLTQRIVLTGDTGKRLQAGATFLVLMGYGDVSTLAGPLGEWPTDLETGAYEPPQRGPVLRTVPASEDTDTAAEATEALDTTQPG